MKPQPKRELAIDQVMETIYVIVFYASTDALEDIKPFGHIETITGRNHYQLRIDRRYDFQEILKYMEDYG